MKPHLGKKETPSYTRSIKGLLLFSVIFFLLLAALLPVTQAMAQRSHQREMMALLGLVAQLDEEAAVAGVQSYFAANQQGNAIALGENVLAQAGYGQTSPSFVSSRYSQGLPPAALWLCLFVLAAGWVLFTACKLRALGRASEEERQASARHSQSLENYYQGLVGEMEQYEGNLYHQLKSPLTSLSLCLEQLTEQLPQLSGQKAYQLAQAQLQKLSRLCTLLLRDKQLSSSKVKFHYQGASLSQLAEDAITQLRPLVDCRDVSIRWEQTGGEGLVVCDELWLTEGIVTILENAVEHTPPGGTARLSLREEADICCLTCYSPGGMVAEDTLSRMFDRFYTQRSGHFGIGLHMARTVAQLHHGRLWAENTEEGVSLILEIPKLNSPGLYDFSSFCKTP